MTVVKLTGLQGTHEGMSKYLGEGDHRVGRDPNCDISVDDPHVSTLHGTIRVGPSEVAVFDHQSRNGISVHTINGSVPVSRDVLHDGTVLSFGPNATYQIRVLKPEPAGFWIRLAAYTVDTVVLVVSIGLFLGLYAALGGVDPGSAFSSASVFRVTVLYYLLCLFIPMGYFTWMHGRYGRSLGKMALGLHLTGDDLAPPSYSQVFLRWVCQIVLASVTLCLFYFSVAVNDQKRGWHDKLAKTRVIRSRSIQ